jgi:hypothetical protein
MPPPPANIPPVPQGFQPTKGAKYRGIRPTKSELVSLPDAIGEIRAFSDWNTTMGKAAYPHDQVVEALDASEQWSTMRNAAHNWDVYCRDKEGTVWEITRGMLTTIGPAFKMAVTADSTLVAKFPNLAAFLHVRNKTAKQAATTRKANAQAKAKGEPAYHGAVGKKRQKKDQKAAAAAAAQQQQPPPPPAEQSTQSQPAAHGTVAVTNGTASPGGSPATNGAANGAAHS